MEQQILRLIEDEVTRRVQIRLGAVLERISELYEISTDRLITDTANLEPASCKGVLKTGERCLKKPVENGMCRFHLPCKTCAGQNKNGPCKRKALFGDFCKAHQKIDEQHEEIEAPWGS